MAHWAGYRCSRPDCRATTAGPSWEDPEAKSDIGVAAHITAASPGGPRYDASLTSEERSSATNGLWLCQTHAKAVDDDVEQYTTEVLRSWKEHAEIDARAMLGRPLAGHVLEAAVEVSLQRDEIDGLRLVGSTNMPTGTKFLVDLEDTSSGNVLGQDRTAVFERLYPVHQRAPPAGGTRARPRRSVFGSMRTTGSPVRPDTPAGSTQCTPDPRRTRRSNHPRRPEGCTGRSPCIRWCSPGSRGTRRMTRSPLSTDRTVWARPRSRFHTFRTLDRRSLHARKWPRSRPRSPTTPRNTPPIHCPRREFRTPHPHRRPTTQSARRCRHPRQENRHRSRQS